MLRLLGLKRLINTRSIHSTRPSFRFRARMEEDMRFLLETLPPSHKLYQNADGTPRQPSELELHKLAQMSLMAKQRTLSFWEQMTLNEEESKLYYENTERLNSLLPSAANGATGEIVDKVPFEGKDGKIEWKIVRADEKEGWENLMYYGFVPALVLLVGVHVFKEDTGVDQWALDELKLRTLEQDGPIADADKALDTRGRTPESIKERDNLIVERILSGEYDKLAGLKKKVQPVTGADTI